MKKFQVYIAAIVRHMSKARKADQFKDRADAYEYLEDYVQEWVREWPEQLCAQYLAFSPNRAVFLKFLEELDGLDSEHPFFHMAFFALREDVIVHLNDKENWSLREVK